jgi:hypothetical protein
MADVKTAQMIRNGDNAGVDDKLNMKTLVAGDATVKICDGTTVAQVLEIDQYGDAAVNIRDAAGASLIGQKDMSGSLPVTMANNQDPIDVNVVSEVSGTPIHHYDTQADVLKDGVKTFTYPATGKFHLEQIRVSASGEVKVEIRTGPHLTLATKDVGFTTRGGNLIYELRLAESIVVDLAALEEISVIITNRDKATMDVYMFINGYNE